MWNSLWVQLNFLPDILVTSVVPEPNLIIELIVVNLQSSVRKPQKRLREDSVVKM